MPGQKRPSNAPALWVVFCRSALVANILCGFIRVLIPFSFSWTVALGYLLIGLMFVELCFDPWWIGRPYGVQIIAIGVVLAIVDIFTIGIVLARAPLSIAAYVRQGDRPGDVVEGIT